MGDEEHDKLSNRVRVHLLVLMYSNKRMEMDRLLVTTIRSILKHIKSQASIALIARKTFPKNANRKEKLGLLLNYIEFESTTLVISTLDPLQMSRLLCNMKKQNEGSKGRATTAVVFLSDSEINFRQSSIQQFIIKMVAYIFRLPVITWIADNIALFNVFDLFFILKIIKTVLSYAEAQTGFLSGSAL